MDRTRESSASQRPLVAIGGHTWPRGCVTWGPQPQATWAGFENSTPPCSPAASHRYRAASQSSVCELWLLTCPGLRVLICEGCYSKAPKPNLKKNTCNLRNAKSLVMSSLSNYHWWTAAGTRVPQVTEALGPLQRKHTFLFSSLTDNRRAKYLSYLNSLVLCNLNTPEAEAGGSYLVPGLPSHIMRPCPAPKPKQTTTTTPQNQGLEGWLSG